jgi:peptidylprolyl isomerase
LGLSVGDVIVLNYTIRVVEEGGVERVVDTTVESIARSSGIYDPSRRYGGVVVVYGRSPLLKAVEEALAGMDVGGRMEFTAPPEKAYGLRREDLVVRVPVKQLQRLGIRVWVGEEVDVGGRRGVISRVTERFAYIDLNHPLAGKTLKIELELVAKAEGPADKARLLASRLLGLDPSAVNASYDEAGGVVTIRLPQSVLGLSDLEARLQRVASDVYEAVRPRRLSYVIDVEYPEEVEAKPVEAGSQPSESSSTS